MNDNALDENLLGYLLGALDDETTAQVGAQIQADPDSRGRLEQLRQLLEPLGADKGDEAPPAGLAVRTLARVAEYCCLDLPRAPVSASRSAPASSWWRRADVLVAASLLITMLGLGLPVLFRLRDTHTGAAMIECENNLRVFNVALQTFHDQHHKYPSVVVERPRDAAGMVVPILAKAGVLPALASVRCPGSGPGVPCPLTLDEARALSPEEFFRQARYLVPSYAYSLGHRDDEGNYHGPTIPEGQQASDFPLMADGPPADGGSGNSGNHGGAGQYVLFADGHVRFVNIRNVGFQKDDIYLNKAYKVAAGLGPFDTVLGPSGAKP